MEQRTQEWFEIRRGKITASNFCKLMGIKALGETGLTYLKELVAETIMWNFEEGYVSQAMQRGIDLEPVAIESYEIETLNKVTKIGFVEYDEIVGGSPDGFIGEDGIIEVKCPGAKQHIETLISKEIPKGNYDQCQGLLFITGRKWLDFVSFNPDFISGKQMIIIRTTPDEVWVEKFKQRLDESKTIINQFKEQLENEN